MRRKTSQICGLEQQLEAKSSESTELLDRAAQAEEKVRSHRASLSALQGELDKARDGRLQAETMATRLCELQEKQCEELEAEIAQVGFYNIDFFFGHFQGMLSAYIIHKNVKGEWSHNRSLRYSILRYIDVYCFCYVYLVSSYKITF